MFIGIRPPLPRLRFDITAEAFECLIPVAEHCCEPQKKDTVRGTNIKRDELAKLKQTRAKPAVVAVNISEQVTRKYGRLSDGTISRIQTAAIPSKKSLQKAASKVVNSLFPKISLINELNEDNEKHKQFFLTVRGNLSVCKLCSYFRQLSGQENLNPNLKHILWKDSKNLILGSPYFVKIFKESSELFADGTYYYTPQGFRQIYRVFGLTLQTVIVPCFTIIMSGQATDDYRTVFDAISELADHRPIAAHTAHFDHEPAAIIAFQEQPCFVNTQQKMCVFHVRNGLHKKVVSVSFSFTINVYLSLLAK